MNACMQMLVQMGGCEMEVYGISVAYHKQLKMELVSYPLPSAYHMEIQRCLLFVRDDAFALKPHTKLVREKLVPSRNTFVMKVPLPGSGKLVNNLWLKIHISLIIQVLLHPVKLLFKDIFWGLRLWFTLGIFSHTP